MSKVAGKAVFKQTTCLSQVRKNFDRQTASGKGVYCYVVAKCGVMFPGRLGSMTAAKDARSEAQLKRGLECKPCAVAAPAVEAQHLASTLLCRFGMFIHAAAAHLLQSRAHDFTEISL